MKKIISISIIFTLILTMLTIATPVFAADSAISIELDRTSAQVGDLITATVRVENIMPRFMVVPIHFNPDVVQVVDNNGNLVLSGVKTTAQVRHGSAGLIPGQALSDEIDENWEPLFWNGAFFVNPNYPEIDNENGFIRLIFENPIPRAIINETLVTIRFVVVGAGDADIRFAVRGDVAYDLTAPNGAEFLPFEPVDDRGVVREELFSVVNTQPLTTTASDVPVAPPPVQQPGTGGNNNNFTTITIAPPHTESNILEYTISERMIELNLARASGETENVMIIGVEAESHINTIIIRTPVSAVMLMLQNTIFSTEFNTPLGIIGFEHIDIRDNMTSTSQYVIATISVDEYSVTIDGVPLVVGSENGQIEPQPPQRPDFSDLPPSYWAYQYIMSLVERGILNGVSATQFAPDYNVTREQFARMLVLALDIYDANATANFPDLATNHWAYTSVASAVNAGIILGHYDGTFGTGNNITRQEMAVMVTRAIENLPQINATQAFIDNADIALWAADAVSAMQQAGIINGFEDGTFRSLDNATRAQAARIIWGMFEL